jgi:hypothetical protein
MAAAGEMAAAAAEAAIATARPMPAAQTPEGRFEAVAAKGQS